MKKVKIIEVYSKFNSIIYKSKHFNINIYIYL